MKNKILLIWICLLASVFADWSFQLQTESEALISSGFILLVEPQIKYGGKAGDHGYHALVEWEIPLIEKPDIGGLNFETEIKFNLNKFSFAIQNELYLYLEVSKLSDEITLEPYYAINKALKIGADIEIDLLSKNESTFDLEIEPTIKYTIGKGDWGKLAMEIEAPVVQLLKKGKSPSDIVETADLWLIYTKAFSESMSLEVLAGGGYNFIKKEPQYKIEPALIIKF